jgi:hypothetical protein
MGDILKLDRPRSSWLNVFKGLEVSLSVLYAVFWPDYPSVRPICTHPTDERDLIYPWKAA